jgi:chorismate synthase
MRANYLAGYYGVTAFGESHGKAMGVVLEDVKPGIDFPLKSIQAALEARRPGRGKYSSRRQEADKIEVISGIYQGKTTGMPICLLIYNQDARSSDYNHLSEIFRPGHADFSWYQKFKIYDHRGGGRASGRETICRVAAGAAVDAILGKIKISAYPIQIGEIQAQKYDFPANHLNWPDSDNFAQLEKYLQEIASSGNSVGGVVELKIDNMPAGLGDPVFEKLDANLAKAIISLGAVKGIEFGLGFHLAELTGVQANDQISPAKWTSNNCGGILGGVSTGQPLILRFVVKPTPSINLPQKTIDKSGQETKFSSGGRHDTLIIPRLIPAAEAMVKLVLADAISHQKLISSEPADLAVYREAFDKIDEDILLALKRRQELAKLTGNWKRKHQQNIEDKSRENIVLKNLFEKAQQLDLAEDYIKKLWQLIMAESKKAQ